MSNFGKWKCTNSNCATVKQGLFFISDSATYERKTCKTCGALMHRFEGADITVIVPSGRTLGLLTAGKLPIIRPKRTLVEQILGRDEVATVIDPDVMSYPDLHAAQEDPRILRPDLYSFLQASELFLVRQENRAATAIVLRCPLHDLSQPVSTIREVAIHVEAFTIKDYKVFSIYPLLYDHPTNPFFAEAAAIPYSTQGNEFERAQPFVEGYAWRKMFYLLSQSRTEIILVDEKHRVVGTRTARVKEHQRKGLSDLLSQLEACADATLDNQTWMNINTALGHQDIESVKAKFPKLG